MARRIFIAVEVSEDLRKAIYKYSLEAFSGQSHIRVVTPENIHITLKFLGNTTDEILGKIISVTGPAVSGYEGFDYSLEDCIGAFPDTRKARIAYIGVKRGSKKINRLFDSVEDGLYKLGIEKETRKFHPHITIARLRKPSDISGLDLALPFSKDYLPEAVSVSIFESILGRQGAKYIIIERFVLK